MRFLMISILLIVFGLCACSETKESAQAQSATQAQTQKKTKPEAPPSCDTRLPSLAPNILQIATHLTEQALDYNVEPFSDCSGIFHRVLDSLKLSCKEPAYPSKEYRSSRDLARWYHERGTLNLVHDPIGMAEKIEPGAVLFYGGRGAEWGAEFSVTDITSAGGINHVGVVTAVQKDADGIVQSYHLFHGLRPGKTAQITTYHSRSPSRDTYPAYGNGGEPWLAVAPIVSM